MQPSLWGQNSVMAAPRAAGRLPESSGGGAGLWELRLHSQGPGARGPGSGTHTVPLGLGVEAERGPACPASSLGRQPAQLRSGLRPTEGWTLRVRRCCPHPLHTPTSHPPPFTRPLPWDCRRPSHPPSHPSPPGDCGSPSHPPHPPSWGLREPLRAPGKDQRCGLRSGGFWGSGWDREGAADFTSSMVGG